MYNSLLKFPMYPSMFPFMKLKLTSVLYVKPADVYGFEFLHFQMTENFLFRQVIDQKNYFIFLKYPWIYSDIVLNVNTFI